jgi:phage-related protein (TIGR01555 family)
MIVNTTQQMNKQLNPDAIAQDAPLTFIAADRWELTLTTYNSNDFGSTTPYEYYGNALHRSRVSRFVWAQAPARIRRLLNGWGMSVLEDSIAPVSAYLKLRKLIFELIDEAKVDVYKIKGFNSQLISAKGTQQLMARIQASNQTKNFQNAITMDVDDDYEQKNLGAIFPGIASLQEQSRIDLCAYLNIPYNKVFGQSSGGFSSGKDALDNYNSTVRNFRTNITAVIKKAGQLRCQQLHGMIPDDLGVEWIPLAVLDGVETEAVKTSQQNRITQRFQLGLTTAQEAMQEMRKNDLCDCDETEVELGLRDAEPPLSENPDEAQANRDHETDMAASAAKDKKKAATK